MSGRSEPKVKLVRWGRSKTSPLSRRRNNSTSSPWRQRHEREALTRPLHRLPCPDGHLLPTQRSYYCQRYAHDVFLYEGAQDHLTDLLEPVLRAWLSIHPEHGGCNRLILTATFAIEEAVKRLEKSE